jgi:apolipoprotein N-acyltransferase
VGLWGLVLVAPFPLWAASVGVPWRAAFRRGFCYGLGFFGFLLWWIVVTVVRYGGLPWVAGAGCLVGLAGYLALFPALSAGAVAAASARRPALGLVLAPIAWTGLEWARGTLFSGFPWGDLPQALWQQPTSLALAPWVGIDGVRLALAGVSAALAWVALRLRGGAGSAGPAWPLALAGGLAVAAVALLARPAPVPAPERDVRVAVVQGNIDQAQKWDPSYRKATLDTYARLSRRIIEEGGDLLLWPETAMPLYAQDPGPERGRLAALVRDLRTPLVFGAPAYVRGAAGVEYRNAVFLMDRQGRLAGRYDKVHLVPFGEYVPLGRFLPFVKRLVAGAGDFTAGAQVRPLPATDGLPALGPLICFEMIFPYVAEAQAAAGARILVVVTNDGWFGRTPGPYQHLAFAAWRAAELGLPLVRSANTGVSAAFDGRGRLLHATRLGEEDAFVVAIPLYPPHLAPEIRVRPWIGPTCLVLAVCGLFAILRSFRRTRADAPMTAR